MLCSKLHLWLCHTVIQHYLHSNLMIPYVDMTVLHKQDQEHRPRHSHATCCTQIWVIHTRATILIYLLLTSTSVVTVPLMGTAFLLPQLMTTVCPGQTHLMDTKINHCGASHCMGHNNLNKAIKLWVTVTSHLQVKLTLMWANNPTWKGFLTQNLASIGSVAKF